MTAKIKQKSSPRADCNETAATKPLELRVSERKAYGKTFFDPENFLAEKFAHLLGQTALSETNLQNLKEMGFRIVLAGAEDAEF